MKKALNIIIISFIFILTIVFGVMGIKLYSNDYNITFEAYTVLILWILLLACILYKKFAVNKCPHCGKIKTTGGNYCPYCGKKITKGE